MNGARPPALPPQIIFWGGTGQAKVNRPIVEHYGSKVVAVFDDSPGLPSPFPDVDIHRGWEGLQGWIRGQDRARIGFCIAIGNPHGRVRLELANRLAREGLQPVTLVHPTAWIADSAVIGEGSQIMAGVVVQPEARLGRQCILNTRASVDHEDVLEDGVELAPGAVLCGSVHIGVAAWICAGAVVIPRIRIGADAIVGAGAVVIRHVPAGGKVAGVPAREMPNRSGSAL